MAKIIEVGETVTYKNKKYLAWPLSRWWTCDGCAFNYLGHPGCLGGDRDDFDAAFGECSGMARPDGNYIKFIEVGSK